MASGHMNRVKRPDTWLHRPMLQNVKKVLANPEPSTQLTLARQRRATFLIRSSLTVCFYDMGGGCQIRKVIKMEQRRDGCGATIAPSPPHHGIYR